MIIPFPEELKPLQKYPLTFTLLALNVVIFILIFSHRDQFYSRQELLKPSQLELTGRLYHEWRSGQATLSGQDPAWSLELDTQNVDQMILLGGYALRASRFIESADNFEFKNGDQVRIQNWKQKLKAYRSFYQEQSIFQFGLSAWMQRPLSWITYQFSHSNWIHLISNMLFLVVMGAAVEALVGSAGLLLIYLFGGVAGGVLFMIQSQHGMAPMVGASASISALMAFYCLAEPRRRIRYFYMLFPSENFFGPIYLPTLLIIPLFLVVDLASLLATPEGLGGGVAYSAHLGGALWGLITALLFRFFARKRIFIQTP